MSSNAWPETFFQAMVHGALSFRELIVIGNTVRQAKWVSQEKAAN